MAYKVSGEKRQNGKKKQLKTRMLPENLFCL